MSYTIAQAEAIGGRIWSAGSLTRVYFKASIIARLIGAEIELYRTGNIKSAHVGGVLISNSEARRIAASKVYLEDGEVRIISGSRHADLIKARVEEALTASGAATR